MIFVTLGSQKFQFDRLLQKLDELLENGTITEPVFAQTGHSTYVPKHYESEAFMDRDSFAANMAKADMVITHAGTGAIIGAVKQGKKTIAVPRLSKYGEHVDDHQLQIVEQFTDMQLLEPCWEVENLSAAFAAAMEKTYTPYVSNTHTIIASIEDFLEKNL
ncbi:MAG: beta(1,3)galactosyltransferase EpsH [Oscillospiraceae bacterium]|nr:beta(1,3)galactosyltransferase EpsH [Oscillospiraceae bacterium]